MLLLKDQEQLLATLLQTQQPHLFIDAATTGGLAEPYRPLLERYRIVDASDVGLLYLQPRTIAP